MAGVLRTELCDRLGIRYPILVAAMGSRGKATPAELVAAVSAAAARAGRWDLHSNPAGQGAGLLRARKPAREILEELVEGTAKALVDLRGRVTC